MSAFEAYRDQAGAWLDWARDRAALAWRESWQAAGPQFAALQRDFAETVATARRAPADVLWLALIALALAALLAFRLWRRAARRGRNAEAEARRLEAELARTSAALDGEIKWRHAAETLGVQPEKPARTA